MMFLFAFSAAIFAGKGFDVLAEEHMTKSAAKTFLFRGFAFGIGIGMLLVVAGSSLFDTLPSNLVERVNVQVWIFLTIWTAAIIVIWLLRVKILPAGAVYGSIVL